MRCAPHSAKHGQKQKEMADLHKRPGSAPEPVSQASPGEDLTRIGEMAALFDVSLRTLRFYEDKGLLSPMREGNTRFYTRRDRARMKIIMLGRRVGFTLRDVKQIIDLYDPGGSNTKQFRMFLEKSEKQIVRLQKQREQLNNAIDELQMTVDTVRAKLGAEHSSARPGARRTA